MMPDVRQLGRFLKSTRPKLSGVRAAFTNLNSGFVRDAGVLSAGTVVARLFPLAAMPLLTRYYSPDDFGTLAVYLGVLYTVSAIACLRLEIAIPIPESEDEAANVLALALVSSVFVSSLITLLLFLGSNTIANALSIQDTIAFIWLLPIGVLIASSYNTFQYWTSRRRRFRSIAISRITQSIMGTSVMLAFGYATTGPLGLILGNIINIGAGSIRLCWLALRNDLAILKKIGWGHMRHAFVRHQDYPKFSTLDALANVAGAQIPIIIIAAVATKAEAGFLFLAMQLLLVPVTLISSSIGQVFHVSASDAYRQGKLPNMTAQLLVNITVYGLSPLVFFGIFAEPVFVFVFGPEWARAGTLVTWMLPWMALQFLASPVSIVMLVAERQRAMLKLTCFGLVLRVASLAFVAAYHPAYATAAFFATSFIYYCVCLFVFSSVVGLKRANFQGVRVWMFFCIATSAGLGGLVRWILG